MLYVVECETALLGLSDTKKLGIISVHHDDILIQEPTLIHTTEGEQIDSSKGTY